ncbi:MAG: hypothetical protein OEZ34_10400 [Spirochaetia bacterium]|nr:hypothetical protein [Spirochaetia bacterium]
MIRFLSILTLLGLIAALSIWFLAWGIHLNHIKGFSIFTGYPAHPHLEMAIGLFFIPLLTLILNGKGYISDLKGLKKNQILLLLLILQIFLILFSFTVYRILFHSVLFLYTLLLWLSAASAIGNEKKGIPIFFSHSLLLALSGTAFWILFDISKFSNAYLAGKILLVYGSMNFAFFSVFSQLTGNPLNLRHLHWTVFLYLGSIIYEVIILIFFKERPPAAIGNGIRLLVSGYWFFGLIQIHRFKPFTFWNGALWCIAFFHLSGLSGLTFLSETGIHYGHLYLAGALTPAFLFSMADFTKADLQSRWIPVIFVLLFFAALTRVTAHFMPDNYMSHLSYASFVMIAAVLLTVFRYRKSFL